MGSERAPDGDLRALIDAATTAERASRDGSPVAPWLDRLDGITDRILDRVDPGSPALDPEWIERWRRLVASVRRHVDTGRVRSVSGIAREARRLALRLEERLRVPVGS